ncbi:hypothetical protein GFM14_37360 [Rhizobium leguminosarum bv. viciae]|uniref:hypothetical protein n=1 Tax=Rhizobium leguminosarum TaxID=384 RepID=UPI00140F70B4|nr:hypothetical protein [Rhizobium leguminosarum]NKJ97101.1 hypothetical protein [Rhizobium leguminosarum bv. viciae]QIO58192.1 hypothetical protein HA463_11055 [Rhizobium leguminosarum bv. trifolii]
MTTNTTTQTKIEGITGRDDYIQAQALIYAIACIQNLPQDRQEWSNMRDMCAIARTIAPGNLAKWIFDTQRHTGTVIDIWPDHDEDLTDGERREKKAFKFALSTHVSELERQLVKFLAEVTQK